MKQYPDFGKWLSYRESIKSTIGIRKGIDNTPSETEYDNMLRLYHAVFAPLCEHYRMKLPVTSFFRNKATNRAVKGSPTSDHMNGNAIDIDCDGIRGVTNKQLFEWAKVNLDYSQLIWEYGNSENPAWVHISFREPGKNKKQILHIG